MTLPTTRVLAVLELLQGHGRMSGTELAARIGVDVRTLRRYIVMLETMGVPITSERGRLGAYLLVAGFKLPPMMFTNDEAVALSIGMVAARGLGLAEAAPAIASAQAKLARVMPARLKRQVGAIGDTVRLESRQAINAPASNEALVALTLAAQQQSRVHLRYRSGQGIDSERDFDPYGLACRASTPSKCCCTPTCRPRVLHSDSRSACSNRWTMASCCAAAPTTWRGSHGSWRHCPSISRSVHPMPCARSCGATPAGCRRLPRREPADSTCDRAADRSTTMRGQN